MYCTNLLVADRNTQTFQLQAERVHPSQDNALEEIISNFFTEHCNGPNIAIICGAPNREILSSEDFRQKIESKRPQKVVECVGASSPEGSIVASTCYCIAFNDRPEGEIWTQIGSVLEGIQKHLAEGDAIAQDIQQARAILNRIQAGFEYNASYNKIFTQQRAQELSSLLNNIAISQGFPDLRILIYFPLDAFSCFSGPDSFFPPQIQCVLKIFDPILALENTIKIMLLQQAVVEEQINPNRALEKSQEQSDKKIARDLFGSFQSMLKSFEAQPANQDKQALMNKCLEWVAVESERYQIPINDAIEEMTKTDPYYADFTAQTYNTKSDGQTLDTSLKGNNANSPKQEKTILEKYDTTIDAASEATNSRIMDNDRSDDEREKDFLSGRGDHNGQ